MKQHLSLHVITALMKIWPNLPKKKKEKIITMSKNKHNSIYFYIINNVK